MLALASALSMLGAALRCVRTALWCALQLTCADLPRSCLNLARQTAHRHLVLTAGKTRSVAAASELWEHAEEMFSDGEEILEEDDENQ